MGVRAGFDGLVRRWRGSAGRPHAAGGRGHVARARAVLYRHLLYARTGADQRRTAARRRRRSLPATRHRHGRRFVRVRMRAFTPRWCPPAKFFLPYIFRHPHADGMLAIFVGLFRWKTVKKAPVAPFRHAVAETRKSSPNTE